MRQQCGTVSGLLLIMEDPRVSIKALFDEKPGVSLASVNNLSVEDISYLVCRGGWPRAVLQKDKEIFSCKTRGVASRFTTEDSDIIEIGVLYAFL